MITLKPCGSFSNGKGYTIDLAENNLPLLRPEFIKLLNKTVLIDGIKGAHVITALESFPYLDTVEHSKIGILVKTKT